MVTAAYGPSVVPKLMKLPSAKPMTSFGYVTTQEMECRAQKLCRMSCWR